MNNEAMLKVSKTRAVGYVRTSTGRQTLSADVQRAALADWAKRNGADLMVVFSDLGVSGALPIHRRPGLLAALDALGARSAHGAEVLLVSSRDRLARDVLVATMAERIADQQGARIVSADAKSDHVLSLTAGMADLFAEYERAMTSKRTVAALAVLSDRGEKVGGVQTYGVADGISAERGDEEREILAAVGSLRASGLSIRAIVAKLATRGRVTRRGGAIQTTQVARILKRASRVTGP